MQIQVIRAPGGGLLVGVPPGYEPLNLLLQLQLQSDPDLLAELIRVAGAAELDSYEIGGDVCWVSVAGQRVTVDTDDGARAVTIDRDEFRQALVDFQRMLDDPPPAPARPRQPWRPPS